MGNIGIPGLIVILVIALIIFGPKRLPEIGSAAGKTILEFKKSASEMMNGAEKKDNNEERKEE